MVWKELLYSVEFKNQIIKKGYFKYDKNFQQFKKEFGINPKNRAPAYLSIDFFSKQSKELRNNGFYVIRTGLGGFIIFDEKLFPKPYLDLDLTDCEEIKWVVPKGFEELNKVFLDNLNEDSTLEVFNAYGVYDELVKKFVGNEKFYIGIRGNKTSKFDVYFKRIDKVEPELIYSFHGQEELDYSLFTDDEIFLIEAKDLKDKKGLDVGWHKMAYPAFRFFKLNMRIIPVYLLKLDSIVYLFIFPDFKFYKRGIILNDIERFKPVKKYKIKLK